MIRILCFIIALATIGFYTNCNPSIKYALRRYPSPLATAGAKAGLQESSALKKSKKDNKEKKHLEIKQGDSMVLYDDGDVKIILQSLELDEIDDMAEELGLYSNQRYYRLPGLSFFKFAVEKQGSKEITFNYFDSYFEDEFKVLYRPLDADDYEKLYTSTSYNRFDYDFIYSFYVVSKEGEKPEGDEFFFTKSLPGREVQLDYKMKGYQVLPFRKFSLGSRKYTLNISISKGKKISIPFYYRPIRGDRE